MTPRRPLLEVVAAIVEAPSNLPEPLAVIEGLRSAALRAVEGDEPENERAAALAALFRAAECAALREQAIAALWDVVDTYLDLEPPPRAHPFESECARLRRLGYSACPTCFRELASTAELQRLDRLRREWLEAEVRRHRGAG